MSLCVSFQTGLYGLPYSGSGNTHSSLSCNGGFSSSCSASSLSRPGFLKMTENNMANSRTFGEKSKNSISHLWTIIGNGEPGGSFIPKFWF